MAEVKPMTTADAPNAANLAGKVYDLRKGADPLVFDRVAAFHPHAATSQEAFDTFKADLDRMTAEAAEAKAKADAAKPAP